MDKWLSFWVFIREEIICASLAHCPNSGRHGDCSTHCRRIAKRDVLRKLNASRWIARLVGYTVDVRPMDCKQRGFESCLNLLKARQIRKINSHNLPERAVQHSRVPFDAISVRQPITGCPSKSQYVYRVLVWSKSARFKEFHMPSYADDGCPAWGCSNGGFEALGPRMAGWTENRQSQTLSHAETGEKK